MLLVSVGITVRSGAPLRSLLACCWLSLDDIFDSLKFEFELKVESSLTEIDFVLKNPNSRVHFTLLWINLNVLILSEN